MCSKEMKFHLPLETDAFRFIRVREAVHITEDRNSQQTSDFAADLNSLDKSESFTSLPPSYHLLFHKVDKCMLNPQQGSYLDVAFTLKAKHIEKITSLLYSNVKLLYYHFQTQRAESS